MKQLIKNILTLLLPAICFTEALPATVGQYSFRELTNIDGLSNSSINCIARDSRHLMWFGTWDGLDTYNGESFTVFKPIPSDPTSISNNIIRQVAEGRGGTMWISTDRGINRYDAARRSFRHYFTTATIMNISRENSFLVAADSGGGIAAWIYDLGFFTYNPRTEEFDPVEGVNIPPVSRMFFDNSDNLWALTSEGRLYRIGLGRDGGSATVERIEGPLVGSVFYDTLTDRFLIGLANGETVICDPWVNKTYHTLPLSGERVTAAAFTAKRCYVGTRKGVYEYDYETRRLSEVLSDVAVLSLLYDEQNILWTGTDGQGVVMVSPTREIFGTFSSRNVPRLDPAPIRAFLSDASGNLWTGTKGGGLYCFTEEPDIGVLRKFRQQDGLLSNSVYALAQTAGNEIWAGTEGTGLNYFDLRRGRLETLRIPERANLTSIYSIHPESDSVLWVGTSGYGLFRLSIDRRTAPFRLAAYRQYVFDKNDPSSINNNVIYAILPDGEGHLWVGTRGGGLNRLDKSAGEFSHYRFSPDDPSSISGDDVLSLARDGEGRLWVGTSTGLNLLSSLDETGARFKRYTESSGIANNTIHGILPSGDGTVWISTNNGLSKIDSHTGKIISYFYGDGLQNNEFSDGAYYHSPATGDFYFGGIGGFNRFAPVEVVRSSYAPSVYLDSFYLNNSEEVLEAMMSDKRGRRLLQIPGGEETFSFLFIPMDYLDGAKCDLRYRLAGYNDNWVQLGSSRRIVFSNLPAGNYTLHVECSSADKEWSGNEFILPIRIMPPWWASWWAFAAYTIFGLLLAYIIYTVGRNRLRMKHSLEMSRFESRKAEEIHQAKLRFFTNIAHEFSTSLTLIYGPCEKLLSMPETENAARRHLRTIESNAARMQNLIQQLMEFRKVETGYLSLRIEPVDIPELIRYTADNFSDTSEEKKISFRCEVSPDVGIWDTDRDALEKILFNLLSNAFKYTPDEGEVVLSASLDGVNLVLSVLNTGNGIRQEEQEQVFDRFTVLERVEKQAMKGHETRYGIGLALCVGLVDELGGRLSLSSAPDSHTLFRVVLPPQGGKIAAAATESAPPLREPSLPEPLAPQPRAEERPASARQETLARRDSVLVIDDNPEILALIREILESDYDVSTVLSGAEALAMLDENLPDLIVCDLIMPVMNGIGFVERLKSNELTRHIPVVFLTSDFSVESRIQGAEVGVDAYITKPFHARHLTATIRQQMERRHRMKEYYESPLSAMDTLDGKQVRKADKEFVMKLARVVDDYVDNEQLSADLLSSEMRLSRMQLYRRLREVTGDTPTEFIRRRRLEHAERMLKTTDLTVQEIMYRSGFNNKAYFYREFAKQYHQTPKEYRNAFRKE